MRLDYQVMEHWPPLAWLATCEGTRVHVRHGRDVEVRDHWFGEVAWDGPFDDAAFDQTDIVAGSGGRVRGDEIVFAPAGSTLDRLQFWRSDDRVLVSNSLACLLASADLDVDPWYRQSFEDFKSVTKGIRRVKESLATSGGHVRLCYFDNLVWDGARIEKRDKPCRERSFPDFETYREFLVSSMAALTENLSDSGRAHPFRSLAMLSSGYDSSTVAVLAHGAGCREVLSFATARNGDDDRGEGVAAALGLTMHVVERDAWRVRDFAEVPFIASNGLGEEVHVSGAEHLLAGRVLFTGHHGDKVWGKDTKALGPDMVRDNMCGLALSEYRLWAGFLTCPVAFWGVRQIEQLHALSNSPEMRPWDIPGKYSRPICRRIVEEAGVERETFGVAKRAVSTLMWKSSQEQLLSPESLADYSAWFHANAASGRRGLLSPRWEARLDNGWDSIRRRVREGLKGVGIDVRKVPVVHRLATPRRGVLFKVQFPWAVTRAKLRYQDAVEGPEQVASRATPAPRPLRRRAP